MKVNHKWLREELAVRGLSHVSFAESVGMSKQMVSLILGGKVALPIKRWENIARFLGIEWRDMKFTGDKKNVQI